MDINVDLTEENSIFLKKKSVQRGRFGLRVVLIFSQKTEIEYADP